MKKIGMMLIAASMATGCATVHESYSSDGQKAYTLNCSGAARGWDKCLNAAGDLCGKFGYTVLDRIGEASSFAGGGFSGGSGSFAGGKTSERSMMIQCKAPT